MDFHIIAGRFCCLPSGKFLLLGLTLEKFEKFDIFPGVLGSPHRGTEAGYFFKSFKAPNLKDRKKTE